MAPCSCQHGLQKEQELTLEIVKNPSESIFYDALAVVAQKADLVDAVRYKRHDVAVLVKAHQEETLQQGPYDFPLVHPPKSQLDGFLNLSLSLEEQVVPEFASLAGVKEEHRSSFWKNVERNKFSWIDTDAVLQNASWRAFFANVG